MTTPFYILRKADEHPDKLVGYAHGDGTKTPRRDDGPALQECLAKGYLVFAYDASVGGRGEYDRIPYQRRSVYKLTDAGAKIVLLGAGGRPSLHGRFRAQRQSRGARGSYHRVGATVGAKGA